MAFLWPYGSQAPGRKQERYSVVERKLGAGPGISVLRTQKVPRKEQGAV